MLVYCRYLRTKEVESGAAVLYFDLSLALHKGIQSYSISLLCSIEVGPPDRAEYCYHCDHMAQGSELMRIIPPVNNQRDRVYIDATFIPSINR